MNPIAFGYNPTDIDKHLDAKSQFQHCSILLLLNHLDLGGIGNFHIPPFSIDNHLPCQEQLTIIGA